jgi:hypothetical protein
MRTQDDLCHGCFFTLHITDYLVLYALVSIRNLVRARRVRLHCHLLYTAYARVEYIFVSAEEVWVLCK